LYMLPVAQLDGRVDGVQDSLGHNGDRWRGRGVPQQDGELVASKPRHQIAVANSGLNALGDDSEHLVTGTMSVTVVDLLETVQVHEDDAKFTVLRPLAIERTGEFALKRPTVEQSRQDVVLGVAFGVVMGDDAIEHATGNGCKRLQNLAVVLGVSVRI